MDPKYYCLTDQEQALWEGLAAEDFSRLGLPAQMKQVYLLGHRDSFTRTVVGMRNQVAQSAAFAALVGEDPELISLTEKLDVTLSREEYDVDVRDAERYRAIREWPNWPGENGPHRAHISFDVIYNPSEIPSQGSNMGIMDGLALDNFADDLLNNDTVRRMAEG